MSRRSSLRVLALVVALSGVLAAPAAAPAAPNVVLILTDDQRWDTLWAMPTVQRELVGRGVTFQNAFVVNPLCCPSRASFLTGRYSHSTGVYSNVPPYGGVSWFDDSSTLATALAAAGYRTGFVGKYLNGYLGDFVPPGWHRWVANAGGFFGYGLNVDGFFVHYGLEEAAYSTDVFANEAVSFIQASPDPFFLVLAPYAPHAPATPASRHLGRHAEIQPFRPDAYDEPDISDKPAWLHAFPPLADDRRVWTDDFRRRQLESLAGIDDAVRRVLETLEASGRLANTMIVFASDNGLLLGEHRLTNRKWSAFEESIRIPFVVRYDALVTAPRVDSRLVTNIDFAPTVAQLAGTALPPVDGTSLVPLLAPAGPQPVWRTHFLIEHLQAPSGALAEVPTYCAVRGQRLKYVVYSTREEELYDLAADPAELVNRAVDPAYRERKFALRSELKALCTPPPPGYELSWLCTHEGNGVDAVLRGTRHDDLMCGTAAAELLIGADGADVLRGAAGADDVRGGAGPDRLLPGRGRDKADGGAGSDVLEVRDGRRDTVVCGRGRDYVRADRRDTVARDCEHVQRPRRPRR
jgi:N-acetylglucosamine-6-sulfatase